MASSPCNTVRLQKPKPVRASPGFHLSKSSFFPISSPEPFSPAGSPPISPSSSPRFPALKKSKSGDSETPFGKPLSLSSLLAPCQGTSKGRLSLKEAALVESELREKMMWESGNFRAEAPCRPENPMVHDKVWSDSDERSGSSTEEESDQEYKV